MKVELDGNTVCGVFCLHYLARKGAPARLGEIARAGRMGADRVRRALRALSCRGLATASRSAGWRPARPVGEITVGDVQEAMRKLRRSGRPCRIEYATCPYRSVCAMTPLCRGVHEGAEEALRASSLGELAADAPSMPVCMERRPRAGGPS